MDVRVGTRAMALGSLVLGGLTLVLTVLAAVDELPAVLVALGGLAVAAAGAWWLVTEIGWRRWAGAAAVLVGLLVIVGAVAWAVDSTGEFLLAVIPLLVLVVATVALARGALHRHLHRLDAAADHRVSVPQHPVLICNPWSGGGKVAKFDLAERARALGVEVIMLDKGLDLEQLARDAVARGADCLGMAGGDGSQALVASVATDCGVPFVCVSAGTRNHFALDLGLDRNDPRKSLAAFTDGVERRIDHGMVGDRFFVNNVSLGVYATIVQEDSYRGAKRETTEKLLPQLLGARTEPFDLQFTTPQGAEVDGAWVVQVSNNPYELGLATDAMQRRRLDTGRLGVLAVSGRSGTDAAALLTMAALGQRHRSSDWHEFTATELEVRSRSGTVEAGVDGEALTLPTPLRFTIHPLGLRLLVPRGDLKAAERRAARNVSVRALWDLARGREPLEPLAA